MRTCSLLMLLVAGCDNDYGVGKPVDGGEDVKPVIEVTPVFLSFSGAVDGPTSSAAVTVRNTGDAQLSVTEALLDTDGAFSINGFSPFDLAPGTSAVLTVTYDAFDEDHLGSLRIRNSDTASSEVVVHLEGTGLYPYLVIDPDPYDFGFQPPLCTRVRDITMRNDGEAPLDVVTVDVLGEAFRLLEPFAPMTLEPDAYVDVPVEFEAFDYESYLGGIHVESSDPRGLLAATLTGQGSDTEIREDIFEQGGVPVPGMDIVVTVDQSGSMDTDLDHIGGASGSLLAALEEFGDYRMIVVTEETGCNSRGFFTPGRVDAEEEFAIAVHGWTNWSSERGFTLAKEAMKEDQVGGCNEGFRRDGYPLHLVHISDEPEQSGRPWYEMIEVLQGFADTLIISAVAGPLPPNHCSRSDPGFGYAEATEATGGVFVDFCEVDWSDAFVDIAESTGETPRMTKFDLSDEPEPDTLEVTVDGVAVFNWSYDDETFSVVFDAAPEAESTIVVRYQIPTTCEG